MTGLILRQEKEADYRRVEELTREVFWNLYVPGCEEHLLIHKLRDSQSFLPELDYVAELDGRIVGHIAYTRACIEGEDGQRREVLCFGPVSVDPKMQRSGVGSALIRHTLGLARELGYLAVCIYGDPRYYSRFGFRCGERYDIRTGEGNYAVPLQALELKPNALDGAAGRFIESGDFQLSPEEVEAFDRSFPPRIKEEQESQKVFQILLSLQY